MPASFSPKQGGAIESESAPKGSAEERPEGGNGATPTPPTPKQPAVAPTPTRSPPSPLSKLSPQAQQQMQRIQAAARAEMANPRHPLNRYKALLATANFGSGEVRTLRSTQYAPLAKEDHEAMDRMHSRTAAALHLIGDDKSAKAQLEAALYHRAVAKSKTAPPSAPPSAPRQSPQQGGNRQVHEKKVVELMDSALAGNKEISQRRAKVYADAVRRVIGNMPTNALERIVKHTQKASFHRTHHGVVLGIVDAYEDDRMKSHVAAQLVGSAVMGCYQINPVEGSGKLILDGAAAEQGVTPTDSDLGSGNTHEVYAHEFGHAIDGPNHEISGSSEWRAAWQSEILGSSIHLSRYAQSKESEGVAEFSRLLYAGEHDEGSIKRQFPKCYTVFARHGLTSPLGAALSVDQRGKRPILREIFSRAIPLPGGDHADVAM